jgi:TonB family protein
MNKDVSSTRTRFWIALGLSILFHMSLGGGLVLTPKNEFARRQPKTEVQLLTPEELKAMLANKPVAVPDATGKQIVETDKTRINDEIDPKAKFLSQFNQRVIKETRAAKTGKFTNDAGQGRQQAAAAPPKTPETSESEKDELKPSDNSEAASDLIQSESKTYESGDVAVAPRKGLQKFNPTFRKLPVVPDPTAEQKATGDGNEVSRTDDHLKDIPTGMQTMLSTREFVYYSYYNRIKDKLRQYWEPKIKEKFEKTIREGRQIASEGDKITKVVIILNEKGTLIGVQILSASGVVDLDDAAVEAFRAAAPFPNPPKGIVEEDGTIKIRWDFVLEA